MWLRVAPDSVPWLSGWSRSTSDALRNFTLSSGVLGNVLFTYLGKSRHFGAVGGQALLKFSVDLPMGPRIV
eukprot:3478583-Pyramimonas_sp.AAC.1